MFEIKKEVSQRSSPLFSRVTLLISILAVGSILLILFELGLINSYFASTFVTSIETRKTKGLHEYLVDGKLFESRINNTTRTTLTSEIDKWSLGIKTSPDSLVWEDVEDLTNDSLKTKYDGDVRLSSLDCDGFLALPFYKYGECKYRLKLIHKSGKDFFSNSDVEGKLNFVSKGFLPRRIVRLELSDFLVGRIDSLMKSIEKEATEAKAKG